MSKYRRIDHSITWGFWILRFKLYFWSEYRTWIPEILVIQIPLVDPLKSLTSFRSDNFYNLVSLFHVGGSSVMQFLETHTDPITGSLVYRCGICAMESPRLYNLRRHLLCKHAKPIAASCPHCNKEFRNRFTRDQHLRQKHCIKQMLFDP